MPMKYTGAEITPETLEGIEELASILIERARSPDHNLVVVPLVGAGASISAGLPDSKTLINAILAEHVGSPPQTRIHLGLDLEAKKYFPQSEGVLSLSLFEFVSILSGSELGKQSISRTVNKYVDNPERRPIAYELLAHLAKHRFIDHLLCLNFDRLLNQALFDELADKLHVISGPDDVPGPASLLPSAIINEGGVYSLKPFGSVEKDNFQLQPHEVLQYGKDSVWEFAVNNIFCRDQAHDRIILVLIGYAAGEPAFRQLLDQLQQRGRRVFLFCIEKEKRLPKPLRELNATHINLDADTALTILMDVIKVKCKSLVWIPVARHHVITNLFNNSELNNPRVRFPIEIVLQAVKSRGFFTLEALEDIDRIRFYGHRDAHGALQRLCDKKVLEARPWGAAETFGHSPKMQDFLLSATHRDLARILPTMVEHEAADEVEEWRVSLDDAGQLELTKNTTPLSCFLLHQFREIAEAPEIEVSSRASPSTAWMFNEFRAIRSLAELTQRTVEAFDAAFRSENAAEKIEIFGVWSTGEWLFNGWAGDTLGSKILELMKDEGDRIHLHAILLQSNRSSPQQKQQLDSFRGKLSELDPREKRHRIDYLDWWRLNRRLTLVRRGETQRAIYMRRRLFTPIVAPVSISGRDCQVVEDIFKYYAKEAQQEII